MTIRFCLKTHWGRDKWPPFSRRHFKCIFLNENALISIKISLKFVPKGQINNIPALVQIMAWRRSGDKPSSEPWMEILLTHICVTRPQWVNSLWGRDVIRRHRTWSTLVQVMSCTLTAPGHYLNQHRLIIGGFVYRLPEGNFRVPSSL